MRVVRTALLWLLLVAVVVLANLDLFAWMTR
jgi:hypothetical protein